MAGRPAGSTVRRTAALPAPLRPVRGVAARCDAVHLGRGQCCARGLGLAPDRLPTVLAGLSPDLPGHPAGAPGDPRAVAAGHRRDRQRLRGRHQAVCRAPARRGTTLESHRARRGRRRRDGRGPALAALLRRAADHFEQPGRAGAWRFGLRGADPHGARDRRPRQPGSSTSTLADGAGPLAVRAADLHHRVRPAVVAAPRHLLGHPRPGVDHHRSRGGGLAPADRREPDPARPGSRPGSALPHLRPRRSRRPLPTRARHRAPATSSPPLRSEPPCEDPGHRRCRVHQRLPRPRAARGRARRHRTR